MMRLISGENGGRVLKTINDEGLRPAMARTREAVFSMLEAQGIIWEDLTILDLFAGCGSVGLECLSRGAEKAWFVEKYNKVYKCLNENVASLNYQMKTRVIKNDVLRFLRTSNALKFDLVFIDPPYRHNYINSTLNLLANKNWLKKNSLVIMETEPELAFTLPEAFVPITYRNFGQTNVNILKFVFDK